MDLKEALEISHIVARPLKVAIYVLSSLLFISICGNIYQACQKVNISLTMDGENVYSEQTQSIE